MKKYFGGWGTESYCVWLVETFRAMTWKYKTLCFSAALSPALLSLAAHLRANVPWDPFFRGSFWALAGMGWLFLARDLANYVRGYRGIRRGVAPQAPNKRPAIASQWFLIVMAAMVCMYLLTALRRARADGEYYDDLSMSLLWLDMLFMQLQSYARDGLWQVPADVHGQLVNG